MVLLTAVPSGFLAYDLVTQKVFEQTAARILRHLEGDQRYVLLGQEVSGTGRRVALTIGGEGKPDAVRQEVARQFASNGYEGVTVTVRNVGSEKFDATQLTQELKQQVFSNTLQELQDSLARNRELQAELAALKDGQADHERLLREIVAQYPATTLLSIGRGSRVSRAVPAAQGALIVALTVDQPFPDSERKRLQAWLNARYAGQAVELVISEVLATTPPRKTRRR